MHSNRSESVEQTLLGMNQRCNQITVWCFDTVLSAFSGNGAVHIFNFGNPVGADQVIVHGCKGICVVFHIFIYFLQKGIFILMNIFSSRNHGKFMDDLLCDRTHLCIQLSEFIDIAFQNCRKSVQNAGNACFFVDDRTQVIAVAGLLRQSIED